MQVKDLRVSVATFVQQLKANVQRLTSDVTTLDVSTYAVSEQQIVPVVDGADDSTVAVLDARLSAADPSHVHRRGFTQIAFDCDLTSCTQTGRTDDVASTVAVMHQSAVDQAVAGREAVLDVSLEVLGRVR